MCGGGGGGGGGGHKHTITLTSKTYKVLLLAVYYSNRSSLNVARYNLFNMRWGGICRIGCANAFSGLRPHYFPLLVDAISCSCKARQARALSKCSWTGCHTASAGTMTEYV